MVVVERTARIAGTIGQLVDLVHGLAVLGVRVASATDRTRHYGRTRRTLENHRGSRGRWRERGERERPALDREGPPVRVEDRQAEGRGRCRPRLGATPSRPIDQAARGRAASRCSHGSSGALARLETVGRFHGSRLDRGRAVRAGQDSVTSHARAASNRSHDRTSGGKHTGGRSPGVATAHPWKTEPVWTATSSTALRVRGLTPRRTKANRSTTGRRPRPPRTRWRIRGSSPSRCSR